MLLAGLADEDAHVDEAGRDDEAAAIAHRHAAHRLQLVEMRSDVADQAVSIKMPPGSSRPEDGSISRPS